MLKIGAVSSVGRASVLQTGGHWFESSIAHHIFKVWISPIFIFCSLVAQLVEQMTVNH